jgi:hypothetical protein
VSTTVTKTLQATFAPPTAHKQEKLNDLLETYRDGLQEAFDSGASTMSSVSDIVTPYDLPFDLLPRLKTRESHHGISGRAWPYGFKTHTFQASLAG